MTDYVTQQEWSEARIRSDYGLFGMRATSMMGSFMTTANDPAYGDNSYRSPWINDYKISRTVNAIQAYIDAGKTYPGALHCVVDDASNNGVYYVFNNTRTGNVEYRKLKSEPVELIQNPKMTIYEAQQDYFEYLSRKENDRENQYVRINEFAYWYDDELPSISVKVTDSTQDANILCKAVLDDKDEFGGLYYLKNLGDYISVYSCDGNSSYPDIFWLDKDHYENGGLISFEWADSNPSVSDTITYQQAKDEYYYLFPWVKTNVEGPWRRNDKSEFTYEGVTYTKRVLSSQVMESFSIFNTFEAAQVCVIQGPEHYPGKLFSVIDDPDEHRNGMYMVTCDISYVNYSLHMENWGAIRLALSTDPYI